MERPLIAAACDNTSALDYAFNQAKQRYLNSSVPDFDILQAIHNLIEDGNCRPQWRHVKGHQSGPHLDIWAQLNIQADLLAATARNDITLIQPPSDIHLFKEKWKVLLGNNKITKDLAKMVNEYATREDIKDVWHQYKRVNEEAFQCVDWRSMETAMKEATIGERHWITKRAARDCGCNSVLMKRKFRTDDYCPYCQQSETVLHVLTCPSAIPAQTWEESLQAFRAWLATNQTDPEIVTALIGGLQMWRANSNGGNVEILDPLVATQTAIGWNAVLEGCLGFHWTNHQDRYFQAQNSKRSGHRWMAALIRRIWKIPWALWERRNLEVHKNNAASLLADLRAQVQTQVDLGPQDIPELQQWFAERELDSLQATRELAYLRMWLRHVKAARRLGETRRGSDREMASMRALMRAFCQMGT